MFQGTTITLIVTTSMDGTLKIYKDYNSQFTPSS